MVATTKILIHSMLATTKILIHSDYGAYGRFSEEFKKTAKMSEKMDILRRCEEYLTGKQIHYL